mmetsp:Transcript_100384/g.184338  ORF Transcript_100384/g.184338 Transcript_100384/m.184338 type:complete len:105 (+) Transcript_100384:58-372(+)
MQTSTTPAKEFNQDFDKATPEKESEGLAVRFPSMLEATKGSSLPFFEALKKRADEVDSLLCVGIDPHSKQLPEATAAAAERHSLDLIAATRDYAACYKPNSAFF